MLTCQKVQFFAYSFAKLASTNFTRGGVTKWVVPSAITYHGSASRLGEVVRIG